MYLSQSAISAILNEAQDAANTKTNGLMDSGDLTALLGRLVEVTRQSLADAEQFQYERDEFARRLEAYVGHMDAPYGSSQPYVTHA